MTSPKYTLTTFLSQIDTASSDTNFFKVNMDNQQLVYASGMHSLLRSRGKFVEQVTRVKAARGETARATLTSSALREIPKSFISR